MGVARVAAVAQNGLWGDCWGGDTVVDSIDHVRAARTARRRHVPRFEFDKCVLDTRCYFIEYAT